MNLGIPLATPEDLQAVARVVRQLRAKTSTPLRGIEIGPWLGRTTLAMLAPNLELSSPLPGDDVLWRLLHTNFDSLASVHAAISSLRFEGDVSELIKRHLLRAVSCRIRHNEHVFNSLFCVDTWKGIDSESALFFLDENPKAEFLRNIAIAGFSHVVMPIEGKSSQVDFAALGDIDFVYVDGSHEYADVVEDLFAIRPALSPTTVLCGHDIQLTERWPGVRAAVDRFIGHYTTDANVWIAAPDGVLNLLSAPPFADVRNETLRIDESQRGRYEDPAFRQRWRVLTSPAH